MSMASWVCGVGLQSAGGDPAEGKCSSSSTAYHIGIRKLLRVLIQCVSGSPAVGTGAGEGTEEETGGVVGVTAAGGGEIKSGVCVYILT